MPTVSTAAELLAALKAATAATVISLAPDARIEGLLVRPLVLPPGVVLTSTDPRRPGKIVNATINQLENLTFRGPLEIEVVGTGAAYGFNCGRCRNITLDGVFIHGILDGDATTDVSGLSFLGGSDITVINSKFRELRQGAGFGGPIERVRVEGNDVQHMRKTGFVFAGASDVSVRGNLIADIRPANVAEHPDAIQFFTTGQKESARNIVIAGNAIHRGGGAATQGIFFRDQVSTLPYLNVTVADNLIVGTGWSAIALNNIQGLTLVDNELVTITKDPKDVTYLWINVIDGGVSRGNRAARMMMEPIKNLTREGDKITKPVADGGLAASMAWLQARQARTEAGALVTTATGPASAAMAPEALGAALQDLTAKALAARQARQAR